jgi:hypothetical protein
MRRFPALLAVLTLLTVLAPAADAASPTPMPFNGQPSSDTRGPVTSVSVDGPGRFGAASVGDAGVVLPDEPDLSVFNLQSGSKAWDALDRDLVNEGGKLAKVANGTGGQGDWLVLVNASAGNAVSNPVTVYQTGGGCSPCDARWQFNATNGVVSDVDITANGQLIAVVTGTGAAQNNSFILLRNDPSRTPNPFVLYRVDALSNPNGDLASVSRFTSVAVSVNSSIPGAADVNRGVVAIVGAETTGTGGVQGAIFVFQILFSSSDLDHPPSQLLQTVLTQTPVTDVDISADGEYAVAGTQGGQLYLVSVGSALQRRGVQNIQDDLRPWQADVSGQVHSVAIAEWADRFTPLSGLLAAGTSDGDVLLYRNQFNPSGSEGALAVPVVPTSRPNVNTPFCPTALHAPVTPNNGLAFSDYGDVLVAGAQDGIVQFDAGALARFGTIAVEPSWCIHYDSGDVKDGVRVDLSGDGKRVFAGTNHRVFGYTNFYRASVDAGDQGTSRNSAPGTRTQFALTVRNDGSLFDRFNLSIAGPNDPGWSFELSNRSLLLYAGKAQTVLVNATTPLGLRPGNFTLAFSVVPERASALASDPNSVTISTNLRLNVGALRRVEIVPFGGTLVASAGTQNVFPVVIRNGGNAEDSFRVSAAIPEPQAQFKSPGSDWSIRVDPSVVKIPPGSTGVVNMSVLPQPANRGDTALVQVHVEPDVPSEESAGVQDTQQVLIAVEPDYKGDIALVENKDYKVWPGQSIFVNFTVKNTGNSRDVFAVKNRTDPGNAPGWRLQLSDERFELRTQGAQKVVRMTVTAQAGLQPGDNVRIVAELFSDGLARQTVGSDGKVDEQSVTVTVVPQPRPKFLGVPAAPEPLLLLGIAALALLARRRGA